MKELKPIERPSLADAMKRVSRGAKLLNKNQPGWQNEIDLDRFDITDEHVCIIGQVFGSYDWISSAGIESEEGSFYGFDCRTDEWTAYDCLTYDAKTEYSSQDYSMLQEAWLFYLRNEDF